MTSPRGERVLTGRHFMNGDTACAEGALSAGLVFFAGYPITPSTEVAERLARRLPEVSGHYMQRRPFYDRHLRPRLFLDDGEHRPGHDH